MRRTLNWVLFCFLALALTASMVFTGCKEDKSSAKEIIRFDIKNQHDEIIVKGEDVNIIYDYENTLWLTVPARLSLDAVYPEIEVSAGASYYPDPVDPNWAYGDPVNLDPLPVEGNPVTRYIITAEDGSSCVYRLVVTRVNTGTMTINMVPHGNNDITVYGLQDVSELVANLQSQSTDIAPWMADLDILLSCRLKDSGDVRYNDDLPNYLLHDDLLISLGARQMNQYSSSTGYVYKSILWYLDNEERTQTDPPQWENYNILRLKAGDYPFCKKHHITIVASKDGIEYSKTLTFAVVR